MIHSVGECGTNCLGGNHFFLSLQLWVEFLGYFIFSVFQKLCVDAWMDGWMVVSPVEFFHLCRWMTMLVFFKLQVIQDARCVVVSL